MSYEYSEDGLIEAATQEVLEDLGWTVGYAWTKESFATQPSRSDGLLGRVNKSEVILVRYLLAALRALNPDLPHTAYQQAVDEMTRSNADKHLAAINKDKHALYWMEFQSVIRMIKGVLQKKRLRLFNFAESVHNDFRVVRQLEVVDNRRPDIIGFVNGIPLVFFELKAHHHDLHHAFDDNLSDYKDTIPEVLHCNAFIILSNGTDARVGTVTKSVSILFGMETH